MYRLLNLGLLLVLVAGLLTLPGVAYAQTSYPLDNCRGGAFSTEEDFMMSKSEPYDGNPYISDGDLLSPNGTLCARNADLLQKFNPAGAAAADLGLDAVDILDFTDRLVAFSTELDDIFGKFTAGDLLFTNGGIIPNTALVAPFGITYDIGLDAVQFIGTPEKLMSFAGLVLQIGPDGWGQDRLQQELKRYGIDIWFSIEGTHWTAVAAPILDGDLLAATGYVVAHNSNLLPNSVPAGLPQRGVDFGLDAVTSVRTPDPDSVIPNIYYSTEILFRGEPAFNDGDILKGGNGVVVTNEDLIRAWAPKADFLGLDALWAPVGPGTPPEDPNIQTMCGDRPVADFDGGLIPIGGGGVGLYKANLSTSPPGDPPRRPCGEYVPIDGFLPDSAVTRFRVSYRPNGAAVPAIGAASGIRTNWQLYEWHGWPINACLPTGSLVTDANGWMDASDYLDAKDGTLTGCANSGLRLAVWDTNNHQAGFGPANKDGHYVLWLEWEDGGGTLHREPVEHHLQLDNTLPTIAAYPDGLQVRLSGGGGAIVPACGEAPAGSSTFQAWGQFADLYYWNFSLILRGGAPPASFGYGPHNYWDLNDGTAGVKNTDTTGTTPDLTTVRLRDIHMTDLGASFTDCCYVLDLWVRDAAIRHSFNGRVANDSSGSYAYQANAFVTFAAAP